MAQDRFDQYYLTLTQAKNKEKSGLEAQALEVYLDIIANYTPDSDYAYERAVVLLEKRGDYGRALEVCNQALTKLKSGDIKGTTKFYEERLPRITEKQKALNAQNRQSTDPRLTLDLKNILPPYFSNYRFLAAALVYLVLVVLISLPDKWFKLAFLLAIASLIISVIELVRLWQKKAPLLFQSFILAILTSMTLLFSALVPPPDWTNFVSISPLMSENAADALDDTTTQTTTVGMQTTTQNDKQTELVDNDLTTLQKMVDKDFILDRYEINIDGNRIDLTLYFASGVNNQEAKNSTVNLLKELNTIKGFEASEGEKLGNLYKEFSVSIVGYDSFGATIINGQVSRATQKVAWR